MNGTLIGFMGYPVSTFKCPDPDPSGEPSRNPQEADGARAPRVLRLSSAAQLRLCICALRLLETPSDINTPPLLGNSPPPRRRHPGHSRSLFHRRMDKGGLPSEGHASWPLRASPSPAAAALHTPGKLPASWLPRTTLALPARSPSTATAS